VGFRCWGRYPARDTLATNTDCGYNNRHYTCYSTRLIKYEAIVGFVFNTDMPAIKGSALETRVQGKFDVNAVRPIVAAEGGNKVSWWRLGD